MAAALEPGKDNDPEEVPEVQAFSGRIEAAVDLEGTGGGGVGARGSETLAGDGLHEAPFLEDFYDITSGTGTVGGIQVQVRRRDSLRRRLRGGASTEKRNGASAEGEVGHRHGWPKGLYSEEVEGSARSR